MKSKSNQFHLKPIGKILKSSEEQNQLLIFDKYLAGLKYIEQFSHLIILWWISENDNPDARAVLTGVPPIDESPEMGVFASRSPYRPNPIGLTIVKLLDCDKERGILSLDHIDAYEETPIIDIKPYITNSEHVKLEEINLPSWFKSLHQPRNI